MEHHGVHKNSFRNWMPVHFRIELDLEMLVFEGKPEHPEENLSEQSREQTTNLTYDAGSGNRIRPHRCEVNALTTMLVLL